MPRPPRTPLPLRHGVSASCIALPPTPPGAAPWASVLDFLSQRLPTVSRADWQARMHAGDVLDEAGQALPPDAPYRGGTRVYYYRTLAHEPEVPFQETICHQDAHLLVVDKPHFLPVTPGGRYVQQSLLVRLKQRLGLAQLSPIHRIDRETAGLVLFSVREADRAAYQALFRQRQVHKVYEAMAPLPALDALHTGQTWSQHRRSRLAEDPSAFFRMQEVPGEPNSETRITLLETHGPWGRYRLEPVTGQRHQLRVHMNALGLPLLGDQFYPVVQRGPHDPEDFSQPLHLLAQAIAFTDPLTGEARQFVTGLRLDWPSHTLHHTLKPPA